MRKIQPNLHVMGCLLLVHLIGVHELCAQNSLAYSGDQPQVNSRHKRAMTMETDPIEQKQTLFAVLKELNKTRGVYFLFADQSLGNTMVNAPEGEEKNVERVLRQILASAGLKYKKVNEKTFVILESKDNVDITKAGTRVDFEVNEDSRIINRTTVQIVTGKVTGENGVAVPGVSVTIKGTTIGTSTDAAGVFSIDAKKGDVLVFSSIGYASQNITVGDDLSLNVSLILGDSQLREVVVTALGIRKEKRSLGYSTTDVDGSKFTQARETNIGNALTGQIAGVSVSGVSTGPSGSSRVTIRGNSSLGGNNQPLYVIDGVPFDNSNQGSSGQWGGADFGDGLSTINPDDIETIQVLKGVAASALYGYRGGNGAILITTKSGLKSKGIGIEVNNNLTAQKIIDEHEYQYQYGQGTQGVKPITTAAAQGSPNSSWGAKLDGSEAINFLGDKYAYLPAKDNWENFYQTGVSNQSSIALTGGNDKGHFRLGLSNLYMNTVIPNSNMKQQGVNFNSTYNITPKLQLNINANYVFETVKNRVSFSDAPGNVIASTTYIANSFDVRWLEPAVNANNFEMLPGLDIYFNNPYFVAYKYQNKTSRNRLTGGLSLKYSLTDWLSVQAAVTRDGYIFDVTNILPTGTGYSEGGNLTQHTTDFHEINGNVSLDANKKFGSFSVHANVGTNTQDNVWKQAGIFGAGPFKVPFFYSPSNISEKPFSYSYSHYRVNSIYGSADFGYKDFLYLTVTARNDWFSTLNINSNDILYPSVSASFVFSDVIALPSWISFGKLRASYAQSSNGTSPYRNLLTYGLQGYTISDQSVGFITQSEIPNNFLKPVKINEQEVGINVQFLDNRLGVDFAWYNKKTTDDILPVTISPTSGYTGSVVNIGELRNQGIELLLTGTPIKTKNFTWTASFNYAVNNNKVLALSPGVEEIVIGGAFPRWGDGVSVKNIVGLPYAQISGYAYKKNDAGQVIYDADGFPMRSELPVPLGSGIYKTTGGFNNDLRFKDLTLSFLIDFKYGAKIYSGTNLLMYSYGLHENTLLGREGGYIGPGVDESNKANTKAVPAQLYWSGISTDAHHVSEEFVYDASFIKLRSVALSYSLPASILKRGFVKGATIGLVARNLLTLMKHTPNIDPESNLTNTNAQGLELSGYPAVRNLGVNVNLKF